MVLAKIELDPAMCSTAAAKSLAPTAKPTLWQRPQVLLLRASRAQKQLLTASTAEERVTLCQDVEAPA